MGRKFEQRQRERFEQREGDRNARAKRKRTEGLEGLSATGPSFDAVNTGIRGLNGEPIVAAVTEEGADFEALARAAKVAGGSLQQVVEGFQKVAATMNRLVDESYKRSGMTGMTRAQFIGKMIAESELRNLGPKNDLNEQFRVFLQQRIAEKGRQPNLQEMQEYVNQFFGSFSGGRTGGSTRVRSEREFQDLFGRPAKEGGYETIEHDFVVMPPETDTHEDGVFVVYNDGGLIPQVHEVEYEGHVSAEDLWLAVEYLMGEDLDPVSIIKDNGAEYEVLAYRRANPNREVYQEGWVGETDLIPEDMRETQPPVKERRKRPGVQVANAGDPVFEGNYMERRQFWFNQERFRSGRITASDLVAASNQLNGRDFVAWCRDCRRAGETLDTWYGNIEMTLMNHKFIGSALTEQLEQEMFAAAKGLREMFYNFGFWE